MARSPGRPDCPRYLADADTEIPGIFTLTDPNSWRVVKYSVFQSSPPNAIFVEAFDP